MNEKLYRSLVKAGLVRNTNIKGSPKFWWMSIANLLNLDVHDNEDFLVKKSNWRFLFFLTSSLVTNSFNQNYPFSQDFFLIFFIGII